MKMFNHYTMEAIVWLVVGFVGQLLFAMRFLIQWLVSEYRKRSVIPDVFWYFSLSGGVVLLAYAIYKRDPVFIVGQSLGAFIYLRNIYLIRRERNTPQAAASDVSQEVRDTNPEAASR